MSEVQVITGGLGHQFGSWVSYEDYQKLQAQVDKERCEHCGCDKIYSGPPDCPRCGAPNCCEICCKEQTLNDRIADLQAQVDAFTAGLTAPNMSEIIINNKRYVRDYYYGQALEQKP